MPPCCTIDNRKEIQSFEDVEDYLDSLGLFHMDLSLDRMTRTIKSLNLKMPCPIVQVVGTNGKGSTATFLHSIALTNGFRTGIFTSPHFLSPLERIRMNDRLLPKDAWPNLVNQALAIEPELTYFELLTIISLMAFAFSEPDLLIYEAGLGAKYDATSAIDADIICVTPIDFDHQGVLGESIEEITSDKSCALRDKVFAAISAHQKEKVWEILKDRANNFDIPLYSVNDLQILPEKLVADLDALTPNLGLKGPHQDENAKTAVMAWQLLCQKQGWHFEINAIKEGLENAFIPGRFQQIEKKKDLPAFILDGAHNVHSMNGLIATLEEENIEPSVLIFSCLDDKEPEKLVALLQGYLQKKSLHIPIFIIPIPDNKRAMDTKALAKLFKQKTKIFDSFSDSLDFLVTSKDGYEKNKPVLICGSLYLLSEYYKLFPHALQVSF